MQARLPETQPRRIAVITGSSYGTVLGAAFRATYPELVRAAVLDGAYVSSGYGDDLLYWEHDKPNVCGGELKKDSFTEVPPP